MTREQKRRDKQRKKLAEKRRLEAKKRDPYFAYESAFKAAKAKGYEFKEGAGEKYTREQFEAIADLYSVKAAGLVDVYAAEEAILDEQLKTSSDSISQAVMLWNTWGTLVAMEPEMTVSKFRSNESEYFRLLRNMYPDNKSYDEAMSY